MSIKPDLSHPIYKFLDIPIPSSPPSSSSSVSSSEEVKDYINALTTRYTPILQLLYTTPLPTQTKPSYKLISNNYLYITYEKLGIELEYSLKDQECLGIHLTLFPTTLIENPVYTGLLPYNIQPTMTGKEIINLFGEPSRKSQVVQGMASTNVWVEYEMLGLQVEFLAKNWEDPEVLMKELVFYKPS